MKFRHLALAVFTALIWGLNYSVVKIGLEQIPPLLLCMIRLVLVAFPAIFFVKKPRAPLRLVALYGLAIFTFQLSLFYLGMKFGMSAGLTALIFQIQIIFSLFLAVLFFKEPIKLKHIAGFLVILSGILLIAVHGENRASVFGLILILGAAFFSAAGNITSKKINTPDVIGLIVWGSLFAVIPLIFYTFFMFEEAYWTLHLFSSASLLTWGCVAYMVYPVTFFGYAVWSFLLNRYPVNMVVPFAILIPVFGLAGSVFILGAGLYLWKVEALLLIVAGLAVTLYGDRIGRRWRVKRS